MAHATQSLAAADQDRTRIGQVRAPHTQSSHTMDRCIFLLNWNDAELTIGALERLLEGSWSSTAVTVLDNGSSDRSRERIKAWAEEAGVSLSESLIANEPPAWPGRLVLLRSEENLGTTGGPNLVIGQALDAWRSLRRVVVMNNDAKVTSETVDQLVSVAEESGAAIVGAAVDDGHGPFVRERWPLDLFSYGLATRGAPPDMPCPGGRAAATTEPRRCTTQPSLSAKSPNEANSYPRDSSCTGTKWTWHVRPCQWESGS